MTYYINPIWFYLMNTLTGLKVFLCVIGGFTLVISIFMLIGWWIDSGIDISDMDDDEKRLVSIFKKVIIASFILLFIGILTPSKETCIEMMIASQVTHENVTATKEEIYEIVDYITDKVKGEEE